MNILSLYFILATLILVFCGIITFWFYHKKIKDWLKKHWKKAVAVATIGSMLGTGYVLLPTGDQPIPDVEAYNIWYAPSNSFGVGSMKTVNWTHFKKILNDNMDWILEYKRYSNSNWTEGNQYLNINKSWNDSGFYKIGFTLNVPVDVYSARFTFGCNLSVFDYVEHVGYDVWFNITANETETYSLMFNWSDIASIPNIVITRGTTVNGTFWFRFRRDNIPAGTYYFDPTFGCTDGGGTGTVNIEDIIAGSSFQCPETCTANNISVTLYSYGTNNPVTCAIYKDSDETFVAQTEEIYGTGGAETYYTFNFSSPPTLTGGDYYWLCAWGNNPVSVDYKSLTGYVRYTQSLSYTGDYPDTFAGSLLSPTDRVCLIYCSYTVGGGWSNTCPVGGNFTPANASTGISFPPTISVACNDTDGNSTTVNFYENSTGSWVLRQTNTSVTANTTVYWNYSQASAYNTKYYWNVTIADETCNVSYTLYFTTLQDTTPPSIIINFAGNLSDYGSPYWRPPNETPQLTGTWANGYYTNASRQSEDWMYINLSVNDSQSTITNVWLNWLNGTTWTNWTYAFTNRIGDYWDYNTSGIITTYVDYNYSFNIVANSSGGSDTVWWNKTGTGGTYTRRYIQLNCSITNITYMPLYFYIVDETTVVGDRNKMDRLRFDQAIDGSNSDTGMLKDDTPSSTVEFVYCTNLVSYWFNDYLCVKPLNITNIYYHFWWSDDREVLTNIGWYKTDSYPDTTMTNKYTATRNIACSNITWDNEIAEYNDTYSLETNLLTITETNFTDNSIYEFIVKFHNISADLGDDPYVSVISNRSFTSFILLNIPSNETLNTTNSDSDGLNDYKELWTYYTNPFLSDTDNDGGSDYDEINDSKDPNNYTSYPTMAITSSVDDISPYWQDTNTLQLNATATGTPSNVTLWYRWATDNISWDGCNDNWVNDTVDSNTSNLDGTDDIGTETGFANCKESIPDSDYMVLTEGNQGDSDCSFGKTSGSGTSYFSIGSNIMIGGVYTATCSGNISSATFYGRSDTGTRYAKIVICDSTGVILTNGVSDMMTVTATAGLKTGTFSPQPTITSGNTYWIMVIADGNYVRLYRDATTGGNSKYDGTNNFGSPTNPTDATANTNVWRLLYATVTSSDDYELDMEYQFNNTNHDSQYEYLCIYINKPIAFGENLTVSYWDTGGTMIADWSDIGTITDNGWSNFTAIGLINPTYNIRIKDTDTSYDSVKDYYNIDCLFLETYNVTCGIVGYNWSIWVSASNPDTGSPWSWTFNFPNSTAYYEFYSIAKKTGEVDEPPPLNVDTRCHMNYTAGVTIYTDTYRLYGDDYIVWLDANDTSAYTVNQSMENITWSTSDYIAYWNSTGIWDNAWYISGLWYRYYPKNASGDNWTIDTFAILHTNITMSGYGNQTINMTENSEITDYAASRRIALINNTNNKGYNLVVYNKDVDTDVSSINVSAGLELGEALLLWYRGTFDWRLFISGFFDTFYIVHQWDILLFKIEVDKIWYT